MGPKKCQTGPKNQKQVQMGKTVSNGAKWNHARSNRTLKGQKGKNRAKSRIQKLSFIPYPTSHIPYPISHIPYPISPIPYSISHIPYPISHTPYPLSLIPHPLSIDLDPWPLSLISTACSLSPSTVPFKFRGGFLLLFSFLALLLSQAKVKPTPSHRPNT